MKGRFMTKRTHFFSAMIGVLLIFLSYFVWSHELFAFVTLEQSVRIIPGPTRTASGDVDDVAFGVQPIIAKPSIAIVSAVSDYEIEFPINVSIISGGKIRIIFTGNFSFTNHCSTPPSVSENNDLNGSYDGVVTIASIRCDDVEDAIDVTIHGSTLEANTITRLIVQGVVNASTARPYGSSSGYLAWIQSYAPSGELLEEKTSSPIYLEAKGAQNISGTVFLDNGSGAEGGRNDGLMNGSELGVEGIQVCVIASFGRLCDITDQDGRYRIGSLRDGVYRLDVPELSTNIYLTTTVQRDIRLAGGNNDNAQDIPLRLVDRSITVNVAGIPNGEDVDVYGFDPSVAGGGGSSRQTIAWNGNTVRTVNLVAQDGPWEVGVTSTATKRNNSPFTSPRPQTIRVNGVGAYVMNFVIPTLDQKILGSVVDGTGAPMGNALVTARPSDLVVGRDQERTTETKRDGTFVLPVASGVYTLFVSKPGLVSTDAFEVTVLNNNRNDDANATADVYRGGILIVNDGGADGRNDLILRMVKGARSISGKVLNAQNSIIRNAFVEARRVSMDGEYLGQTVRTFMNANDAFVLFVSDGRWHLRAFAQGYGKIASRFVTVAGLDVSGANLQEDPSMLATVSGTVRKNGVGVGGAFVTVFNNDGAQGTTSDNLGRYLLTLNEGSGYAIQGFLPGVGSISPITNLTLNGGSTTVNQDLDINEFGTIQVTIAGVTDAFVDARDEDGNGNGTSTNLESGIYELNVPSGTYIVRAHSMKFGLIRSVGAVEVQAGQVTALNFPVSPTHTVSGSVTSDVPYCASFAHVIFSQSVSGRTITRQSDVLGAYAVTLPNGTYRLSATKPGCLSQTDATVVVANADVLQGTNIALTASDTMIRGRAILNGTNVTSQTAVVAKNSNGNVVTANVDVTQAQGNNFSLPVQAGTWTLTARSDGYVSEPLVVRITSGNDEAVGLSLLPIDGYVRRPSMSMFTIPQQGGLVKDAFLGDGFDFVFPSGVLGTEGSSGAVQTRRTTALIAQTRTAKVLNATGFEIQPENADGELIKTLAAGSAGVLAVVPYDPADVLVLGVNEEDLVLATWSEQAQEWIPLATTVDTVRHRLSALITHFSLFAPIAFIPPVFQGGGGGGGGSAGGGGSPNVVEDVKKLLGEKPPVEKQPIVSQPIVILPTTASQDAELSEQPSSRGRKIVITPTQAQQERISLDFHVLEKSKVLTSGDELATEGSIEYAGQNKALVLHYQIADPTGRVIFDELEAIPSKKRFQFSKTFLLSNVMMSGTYEVLAKLSSDDRLIDAMDTFQIVEQTQGASTPVFLLRRSTLVVVGVLTTVVVMLLIVVGRWFWLVGKKKKRSA